MAELITMHTLHNAQTLLIRVAGIIHVQGATTEYLVLWKDWPKETSQWLSAGNIGSALIRYIYTLLYRYE